MSICEITKYYVIFNDEFYSETISSKNIKLDNYFWIISHTWCISELREIFKTFKCENILEIIDKNTNNIYLGFETDEQKTMYQLKYG